MVKFFQQIHQEANGQYSWTRFASTVALFVAIGLTAHQTMYGVDHFVLISTWLAAALGTKTLQKFAESKEIK